MSRPLRSRRIDWRWAPSLTTALIDVDLALTNIVPRFRGLDFEGPNGERSEPGYALECLTRLPAEAPNAEAETHLVYLSGYVQSDRLDREEDFDPRSVCYIVADRRPGHTWRTNIYIENYLFRRLVELFMTRRIDATRISILVRALRESSGEIEFPTIGAPALRTADGGHGQHNRGHLMAVQTSLAAESPARPPGILFHARPRGRRSSGYASSDVD